MSGSSGRRSNRTRRRRDERRGGRAPAAGAKRRRNLLLAGGSVALVVIAVAVMVGVRLTRSGAGAGTAASASAPRQPAPAAVVAHLTGIPLSTLVAGAAKAPSMVPPQPIQDPPLASGGKPEMLYIGAEFCPICATERWAMVVALSHFGTFTHLSQTHSAVRDGNIPTLSFYGSTFTSPYLSFVPVETTTNQPSGNYYQTLETPTAAQMAIWQAHEGQSLGFPFIDIGGRWLFESSQFPDTTLHGQSFAAIAQAVGDNSTTIGVDVDAAAAALTKYICSMTGEQPAATCQAVASVGGPGLPAATPPAG